MKISKNIAFLAYADELVFEQRGYEWSIKFDHDEQGVFIRGDKKRIFLLRLSSRKRLNGTKHAAVARAFEDFTGWEQDSAFELTIPKNRETLTKIGTAKEILYWSDKWTGKKTLYTHKYKKGVSVFADRSDPNRAQVWALKSTKNKRMMNREGLIL